MSPSLRIANWYSTFRHASPRLLTPCVSSSTSVSSVSLSLTHLFPRLSLLPLLVHHSSSITSSLFHSRLKPTCSQILSIIDIHSSFSRLRWLNPSAFKLRKCIIAYRIILLIFFRWWVRRRKWTIGEVSVWSVCRHKKLSYRKPIARLRQYRRQCCIVVYEKCILKGLQYGPNNFEQDNRR